MIEAIADELFAEVMAQNAGIMANYTDEQREEKKTSVRKRCREFVANLSNAIDARDVDTLLKAVNGDNSNARKLFKTLTGIDPGRKHSSCREAIRQYVGAENFERYQNESTAQAAERQADWRRKQEEKEREAELGRRLMFRFPNELAQAMTVREMIDGLFARGFRPQVGSRGFAKTVKLTRPGESLVLRKKWEMAYALEKAAAEVTGA